MVGKLTWGQFGLIIAIITWLFIKMSLAEQRALRAEAKLREITIQQIQGTQAPQTWVQ